jgi:DNA end-binding protein Ku
MARPIWKGQLTFGLVNVPMTLHSGERPKELKFHLVDSRSMSRVRYERISEETGEEVPWDKIVKAFEHKDGDYVVLSDKEMERANVQMTHTIDIEQFVDVGDIDIRYFERPYYLAPAKGGEKGYVLLREAMAKANKAAIARIVIRTRQRLCTIVPFGDALVLDLLRFDQEVVPEKELDLPGHNLKRYRVSPKEVDLAQQLIKGMTNEWKPSQYHDEYRDVLMKLIQSKIKSGKTREVFEEELEEPEETPSINFMEALKKSMEKPVRKPATKPRRAASHSRKTKARAG